jgi:ribosomal-protein-alanine N-acetyltransferase
MNDNAFELFPSIETKSLVLKEITEEHEKDILLIFSDDEVMTYYDLDTITTIDEARNLIGRMRTGYEAKRYIRWGISKKENGNAIGTCGFYNFARQSSRAELGYILAKKYWKQGIMTEALEAIITFGFREMMLHRIEAFLDPDNIASKLLLAKLGFREEGYLRERDFIRGSYKNSLIYSVLKNDYLEIEQSIK